MSMFDIFLLLPTGNFNIIILDRVKLNIALQVALTGSEGLDGMKVNNIMHIWSRLFGLEHWQGFRPTRTISTSQRINSMSRWRHCNFPALVSPRDQSGSARDAR